MTQHSHVTASNGLDHDRTLILAVEVSGRSWIVAAQVPGLRQKGVKQQLAPRADALMAAVEGYKRRAAAAGMAVERVIVAYESGGSGFWLARWLQQRGVEVYVMQPSSVPVDRRMRRAKSDRIDADMLLRTLLAWLRGEPRVCSMVPVPDEAVEDARRPIREREELIRARVALVNRIEAVLTVLGAGDYNPLRRDCRERLGQLRTALDQPLPPHARAQIERLLDRLDLIRHDRGPGAKAPDRALAIPPGRRRAAGDGAEASLTGDADNDMAGGIWAGATPANADRRIGPDPPGGAGPVGPRERRPGRNVGCLTAPLM